MGDFDGESATCWSIWLLPETSKMLTSASSFDTPESLAATGALNIGLVKVVVGVGGGGAMGSGSFPWPQISPASDMNALFIV